MTLEEKNKLDKLICSLALGLFSLFMALRLTDRIDWSYVWVTSPIWGLMALAVLAVMLDYLEGPRP